MNINEKAAYIKGCFDFSDLNKDSKEIKIMEEMLDLIRLASFVGCIVFIGFLIYPAKKAHKELTISRGMITF